MAPSCGAIPNARSKAAEASSDGSDLLGFGVIDEIVAGSHTGGAHTNHELAAALFDSALERALAWVSSMDSATRLEARYQKFRAMGNVGISE